jgi:hypothetical protein
VAERGHAIVRKKRGMKAEPILVVVFYRNEKNIVHRINKISVTLAFVVEYPGSSKKR